ncbi:MAG TPA: efflux RND transporter periplasmic adaptor subunit [Planctomycetota bacterium]
MVARTVLFVLSAIAAAAGAVGTSTLLPGHESKSRPATTGSAPALSGVRVMPAEQRLVAPTADFTARLEAAESVEVRPRVSGHLVEVRFRAGQRVAQGDVLFVVDPRWQRAEVARTTAELEQANARVVTATREHERAEALLSKLAISREEAERRHAAMLEARAAVSVGEAAVQVARLELAETEVKAPIAGHISRALVTVGNYVSGAPGTNTVLATILSTEVHAYVHVDEAAFLALRRLQQAAPGAPLPLAFALGGETGFPRRGTLESFDNRVDGSSGNLLLRAILPNPDGELVPGLFGRVRIATGEAQPSVLVPERALGTDQGQRFVLVVDDAGVVQYRAVKPGFTTDDGQRVVTKGLQAGERVVVDSLHFVRPGMRVTPQVAGAPTN